MRISYHSSPSQLGLMTTNRILYDQQTPYTSVCPYECDRVTHRHTVIEDNVQNLLSGVGLAGEGFFYMGVGDNAALGFARYDRIDPGALINQQERVLRTLHMSRNVTLEACDAIVQKHKLLAPHAVWMINRDAETRSDDAGRVGDCGLFLGARSNPSAQLWRASYEYARLVTRLGHFESVVDSDVLASRVHTASEGPCVGGTSRVCVWWSEHALDAEAYSCRPKRDASNVITPARLLQALEENGVRYPPPAPPPPSPPEAPPPPSPSPNTLRCELSAIASTDGYKVYAPPEQRGTTGVDVDEGWVQKQCWKWDRANDWPPVRNCNSNTPTPYPPTVADAALGSLSPTARRTCQSTGAGGSARATCGGRAASGSR